MATSGFSVLRSPRWVRPPVTTPAAGAALPRPASKGTHVQANQSRAAPSRSLPPWGRQSWRSAESRRRATSAPATGGGRCRVVHRRVQTRPDRSGGGGDHEGQPERRRRSASPRPTPTPTPCGAMPHRCRRRRSTRCAATLTSPSSSPTASANRAPRRRPRACAGRSDPTTPSSASARPPTTVSTSTSPSSTPVSTTTPTSTSPADSSATEPCAGPAAMTSKGTVPTWPARSPRSTTPSAWWEWPPAPAYGRSRCAAPSRATTRR